MFSGGIWDKASLFNQTILNPSGPYSTDGVHLGGAQGPAIMRKVSALAAGIVVPAAP